MKGREKQKQRETFVFLINSNDEISKMSPPTAYNSTDFIIKLKHSMLSLLPPYNGHLFHSEHSKHSTKQLTTFSTEQQNF